MTEPAVTDAMFAALVGNATLIAGLKQYPDGGVAGAGPAVFSEKVPKDARFPFVVMREVDQVPAIDSKTRSGRDHLRDIAVYTDADDDDGALVGQLAEAIRALFHRSTSLAVAGSATFSCQVVSGPMVAPADEGVHGRILTVRVVLTAP